MKLDYYVLGKKNNKLLMNSLEKYYDLLLKYVEKLEFKNKDFLLKYENKRDFIISPDISSMIEILYLNKKNNFYGFLNIEETQKKLEQEIIKLKNDNIKSLIYNLGENIGNTNIKLTTNDYNPVNGIDEHPDHTKDDSVGWGTVDKEKWLGLYSNVFDILKKADSGFFDELNFIIKKIVPIGTSDNVHNSASYAECIGHLYMGYTKNAGIKEAIVLEAIIHESSHNKLNLIHKFDKLLLNDYNLEYYSPYRPDARHVWGVFLGVHALTPTVYVLVNAYKKGLIGGKELLKKALVYNKKNMIGLSVLEKYGKFTDIGKEIISEIKYTIKITNVLLSTLDIDKGLQVVALKENKKHLLSVKMNYSYLKY